MQLIATVSLLAFALLIAGCQTHHEPSTNPALNTGHVTGIGGVFFKCKDPRAMRLWYGQHLGMQTNAYGANFEWQEAEDPTRKGSTQWTPFPEKTKYFQPSTKDFMINYRVKNLDLLIQQFKADGVTIVGKVEVESYGKFCHILDPEGNAIELWEPSDAGK